MPFRKLREKMPQANKALFWGSPGIVKNSIQPQNVWTQGNTWSSQGAQLAELLGCVHTATLLWPPFAAYLVVINRQSLGLCSGHPTFFFFFRRTHPSLGFTHYLSTEKWKNLTSSLGSKLSSTTVVRYLLLAASHLLTQVLKVKIWLLPITPVPAPWQSPSQQ